MRILIFLFLSHYVVYLFDSIKIRVAFFLCLFLNFLNIMLDLIRLLSQTRVMSCFQVIRASNNLVESAVCVHEIKLKCKKIQPFVTTFEGQCSCKLHLEGCKLALFFSCISYMRMVLLVFGHQSY
ncbi:hypothetical protein HPP92_027172 [Vanilla planifolia]|uniref:Uncharacterized protein n=1 Tax=Vanilla planifolia TaxID=51239 RepID=A0A835PA66_VANPL|nr:hypothetical protein HPP92_027172 [Vanilla planifolia]